MMKKHLMREISNILEDRRFRLQDLKQCKRIIMLHINSKMTKNMSIMTRKKGQDNRHLPRSKPMAIVGFSLLWIRELTPTTIVMLGIMK